MNISEMKSEMEEELLGNILPFWIYRMTDTVNGGFYGQIKGDNTVVNDADKGSILNARILWTFASAYRIFRKEEYLDTATRAKQYILEYFYDNEHGGIYWMVDWKGNPVDTKKQIYALAFVIYGLSEYYRATSDKESLEYALKIYETIENYSYNETFNGYLDAFSKDWNPIYDMRLSDKDKNESFTLNTHLHILEAYTSLYRVYKDAKLKSRIENLINIFTDRIINADSHHLDMFFTTDWNSPYNVISFGHDVEASWLICEAIETIGENSLLGNKLPIIKKLVLASQEGLSTNGGLIYESNFDENRHEMDFHWWVQAENILGNLNMYRLTSEKSFLDIALNSWRFIKDNIIDRENGEWFWSVDKTGVKNITDDKAGFWKCPYHNGRLCMEIIEKYGNC